MKILVCIKQVPGTTAVEIDEKTGVLKRDGVESKMNPYDLYAIEEALKLRERYGGNVDVLTMGPKQAEEVLREAVYMGADRAFLISDRRFGGADVAATSYTLAQGIRKAGDYDVILCGKQTTDGDTAQVGPETAEFLGIEHISNVQEVLEVQEEKIIVRENQESSTRILSLHIPCLLTIEKDANTPRLPSFKRKLEQENMEITVMSMADFQDQDASHYGLTGSPTQVECIFPPEKNASKKMFRGSGVKLSGELLNILRENKFV